jgi:signal transduction histidine kinase/MFS family permease
VLPLLLLAILLILLAARILVATPRAATNRWFAAFTGSLAAWVLFIALLQTGSRLELWGRLSFASASLIPPTLLVFAEVFPHRDRIRWHSHVVLAFSIAIFFAFASLLTPWIIHSVSSSPYGIRRTTGPLYISFAAFFLLVSATTLLTLLRRWRHSRGLVRAQLQYLATGVLLSAAGAITTNLLLPLFTGRSTYAWLGPYFLLPMVALIGYAILHYRLLDVRVILHRTVAFTVIILAVAWGFIGLLTLLNPRWAAAGVTVPFGTLVTSAVAALVLSIGIAPRLGRLVDRYVLAGVLAYHHAVREAARTLPLSSDSSEIANRLRHILSITVRPELVALLARIPHTLATESLLSNQTSGLPIDSTRLQAPAWRLSDMHSGVLLLPSFKHHEAQAKQDHEVLTAAGFEVLVTLGRRDKTAGVLLLGPRAAGEAYFAPELDFLEQLSDITGLALELVYLQRRRVALDLQHRHEAELARSARLYAEVAHEIRTPLTTISNLVAMLPEQYDDADYRRLLSELVPAEVSRIVALSERLRTPRTEPMPALQQVCLSTLLRDVVSLEAHARAPEPIDIRLALEDSMPRVTADPDSLVRLFRNLIRNALDASPPGASISIRTYGRADAIVAEIIDEGSGLDPRIGCAVSTDFLTTKPRGFGLGLSICHQIANAHSGTLTVENRADGRAGVRAALTLPLHMVSITHFSH